MKKSFYLITTLLGLHLGCTSVNQQNNSDDVKLLVIDPQHFHAALVQKYNNPDIDSVVHLFADSSTTVAGYTQLIEQYNTREEKPTHWNTVAYFGKDFEQKAFEGQTGNVVVLAGENNKKIDYIMQASSHGRDVFADKPLVIDHVGYQKLNDLLGSSAKGTGLIYDIMTERYDVKNQIIKELLNNEAFSGGVKRGTTEPAIQFRSVHHFIKEVSGKPLIRPAMFFNTKQQGEGLVDVTTHYIDLIQWMLSPEAAIDVKKDITLKSSSRWQTRLTKEQFMKATNLVEYPSTLVADVATDHSLGVYSNGRMDYTFKGVPISIAVKWNAESLDGRGDQFNAFFKTTKLQIEVKPDEAGKASIFITPVKADENFEKSLQEALSVIPNLNGLNFEKEIGGYKVIIPDALYLSHEDHFTKVLDQFLVYKKNKEIPEWEKSYILAKYYLTTQALKQAKIVQNENF